MKTTTSTSITRQYVCELTAQDIESLLLSHVRKNDPDAKPFINANAKFEVEFDEHAGTAIITAQIKENPVS